MWLMSWIHL
ncbi:hypothetical protein MTR67_048727 [Solanum verrucosum]|uniref:Uncharacterized protein n=1 Tax=Solanum verrucosum TaxID=315347 RepID=A0AAF0UZ06_SOLVR|nr:hypothetical protein MTR67_048727 [Solanum verrucosum]